MSDIASRLLPWFEVHGRKNLPWQQRVSAYRVWLSEIMLQQTQVATAIPYFVRFIQDFPTLKDLAEADLDQVLNHWAGLGYYARARNLHKTAIIIMRDHQGDFPQHPKHIMALPGIGRSTAGAILSLAYGRHSAILDGNVKRVLSRLYQIEGWPGHSATVKTLWTLAERQTPARQTAHYNQAMMDLGAMVCVRSRPRCQICPLTSLCKSFQQTTQADFPQARPKKERPQRHCWMLLHRYGNQLLIQRRPEQGIWGGLWSLPELQRLEALSDWQMQLTGQAEAISQLKKNLLIHRFSHFDLLISVAEIHVPASFVNSCLNQVNDESHHQWVSWIELKGYGLPAPVNTILTGIYEADFMT